MTNERMDILERFGDSDMRDLVWEIRKLRADVNRLQLALIEANNPGIDMDLVRKERQNG